MNAIILSVDPTPSPESTGTGVVFEAAFGKGRGLWMTGVPEVGKFYEVEISVDGPLVWDWDICAKNRITEDFQAVSSAWHLEAVLEDIEDDGLATLLFGDTRLLVDTDGPSPEPGTRVMVKLGLIRLFPELP